MKWVVKSFPRVFSRKGELLGLPGWIIALLFLLLVIGFFLIPVVKPAFFAVIDKVSGGWL